MKIFLAVPIATLATSLVAGSGVLVEREAYVMGTRVRMAAADASRAAGLERLDRALSALEAVEAELSTWKSDTEVASLNRSPVHRRFHASRALCELLEDVAPWHEATSGAFDPAIGRLLDAWGIRSGGRIPTAPELAEARALSGLDGIDLDSKRCTVTRMRDVTIDAGAFGKGAALDRAARVLGPQPWMVDLGGQISVSGRPPSQEAWAVAIAHPTDRHREFLTIRMTSGSLATSGGSERDAAAGGQRISHILDPRTGQPASFEGSVTVWHERALVADILSTALFVMGPDEGLRWASARGLSACFLVPQDAGRTQVLMTPAFQTAVLSSHQ